MPHFYDVAISFSGEDRPIARQIAESLRKRGIHVFFDEYAQSELWGRNLYDYLTKIYEESKLCIVIVSESYTHSQWASSELRNLVAHSRLRDSFAILPIIVGAASTGLLGNLASLNWSETNADDVAALVEERLQSLPRPSKTQEHENYHVIMRESGWSVKRAGASRATSVHKTQEEAIAAARRIAGKHRLSELVIHREDGTIASREVIKSEESHAASDD
ncbi:DUF2188 domain-containing protein [Nitrosomonas sp.]|uniref:DUF2188 domain-containing protein n=1 Tax=Nitrosomonas sp. TaxID=42353 RepID=UPI00374D9F1D